MSVLNQSNTSSLRPTACRVWFKRSDVFWGSARINKYADDATVVLSIVSDVVGSGSDSSR